MTAANNPGPAASNAYANTAGVVATTKASADATPAAGTSVTINDTAPTNHRYNLTICEIRARP